MCLDFFLFCFLLTYLWRLEKIFRKKLYMGDKVRFNNHSLYMQLVTV